MDSFAGCSVISWWFFSVKISSHSLLTYKFSAEKSAFRWTETHYVLLLFFCLLFYLWSLRSLIIMSGIKLGKFWLVTFNFPIPEYLCPSLRSGILYCYHFSLYHFVILKTFLSSIIWIFAFTAVLNLPWASSFLFILCYSFFLFCIFLRSLSLSSLFPVWSILLLIFSV